MSRATVSISRLAESDLISIGDQISEAAGWKVARRWVLTLRQRAYALADQPLMGQVDGRFGLNRRRVVVSPYLIVYAFFAESHRVEVLRILHGARDIPSLFSQGTGDADE